MTTVTHSVVFSRQFNENSCSPMDPTGLDPAAVDLEATGWFCLSGDNDMQVQSRLYEIRQVSLPAWLSVNAWLSNSIKFRYIWAAGVSQDDPEAFQRACLAMSTAQIIAAVGLLRTKKFRSAFRASLAARLTEWLDETAHQFASPFSHGQWAALCNVHVLRQARAVDSSCYRNR